MRYPSIDLLRTIAIFVMVLVHFGENLSGRIIPFVGFGAPLFVFLSGVSYCLWVKGHETRGFSEEAISKVSVRRGLFVFGLGFAFNVLVWLPEDAFNWDVLTFVGAGLLLLNLARRHPLSLSVLAAVLALLMSPIMRGLADYGAYWEKGYFECELTLTEVLVGFLVTGYFPVFPWIVFTLAGFVTASHLFVEDADRSVPPRSPWPTVLMGAALVATSLLLLGSRAYLPAIFSKTMLGGWKMYPPTIEYVLGTLGITLMLIGLAHQFVDRHPRLASHLAVLNVAKTFSRYSLTIYVVHHVVHLWPLWIYAVATGREPTALWRTALPITYSLPLSLLFLACCYGVLRRLGSDQTYGIESWMRWLCDESVTQHPAKDGD